ncbi:unnamed protein product [Psylliodes chrysocephalus]|uniref:Uncharacterized protein n=1 Tax=Psylliodes chrysocephalus TaxID=3402493 RepID=A0A9P0CHP3_9CUCU|nr:unnamed protein product [Psylliodes chrysocephala]
MNDISNLFYTGDKAIAGDGAPGGNEEVELLGEDFLTAAAEAAVASDRNFLLGSLERADYLRPPPTAAPAPAHVAHMSIGSLENAGCAKMKNFKVVADNLVICCEKVDQNAVESDTAFFDALEVFAGDDNKVDINFVRINIDNTTNDLESILIKNFPEVKCEKLNSQRPEIYSSFKVTILESHFRNDMNPELWPL